MKRLVFALPFALLTHGAFAQDVPAEARMDLWCGMAFQIVIVAQPDATPDDLMQIDRYLTGAAVLIERGTAGLLAAGFDQAGVDRIKAELLPVVTGAVNGTEEPEFSPDDCGPLVEAVLPPISDPAAPEWWKL
jgi:hypothetical protein